MPPGACAGEVRAYHLRRQENITSSRRMGSGEASFESTLPRYALYAATILEMSCSIPLNACRQERKGLYGRSSCAAGCYVVRSAAACVTDVAYNNGVPVVVSCEVCGGLHIYLRKALFPRPSSGPCAGRCT